MENLKFGNEVLFAKSAEYDILIECPYNCGTQIKQVRLHRHQERCPMLKSQKENGVYHCPYNHSHISLNKSDHLVHLYECQGKKHTMDALQKTVALTDQMKNLQPISEFQDPWNDKADRKKPKLTEAKENGEIENDIEELGDLLMAYNRKSPEILL
ncbi:hypothetical protein SNEBB_008415 [Seison nebaliae]|nr:hypothetical protein SNEBB_008415 [Seison nebaliae]